MLPFFSEVFVTFVKEKGRNCWVGSTGAPQGQDREVALCHPFSIPNSSTPFSSSSLQSTSSCYPRKDSQEPELVPGWERQMWMWEAEALSRALAGLEKGRHPTAPNTGLEAEQARKESFSSLSPLPTTQRPPLEPDPAGRSSSHDFLLFFLSALAAPFFSYILISYPVPCMNKRCHILPCHVSLL